MFASNKTGIGTNRLLTWLIGLFAVVILASAAIGFASHYDSITQAFSPDELTAWLTELGYVGPGVFFLLMVSAIIVPPLPTAPITIAAGLTYGFVAGFTLAIVAAACGALLAFMLGRWLRRLGLERFLGEHIHFCSQCSDVLLFKLVLASRLIPVISFALVSYGAGITAMTIRGYLLATVIGMLPMTAVYVAMGAVLTVSPVWAGVGGILAVLILVILPRLVELGYFPRMMPSHFRELVRRDEPNE